MKNNLFDRFLSEISGIEITFSPNKIETSNIFEEHEPENLLFNGYSSSVEYRGYLLTIYYKFKETVDENLQSLSITALEEAIFDLKVLIQNYRSENIKGKEVLMNDLVKIDKTDILAHTDKIKWKLSGYFCAQERILKICKQFLKMRLRQYICIDALSRAGIVWTGKPMQLLELAISLWYGNFVHVNKVASEKGIIEVFMKVFNVEIENLDVLLNKIKTRKKDVAPFSTLLHKIFEDYVNSYLLGEKR